MKFIKHLYKIHIHRKWVRRYCFGLGLYWQGLTHDLSKYSPTEFFESVKFYQGTSSPIDAAKKAQGYSLAWFHHRGRNKHHHVYWVDNFDEGMTFVVNPYKYMAEMICDFIGAGRAYMGKNFTYRSELNGWNKRKEKYAMAPVCKDFVSIIFESLAEIEDNYGMKYTDKLFRNGYGKRMVKEIYEACIKLEAPI